jgi:hypothetical protein
MDRLSQGQLIAAGSGLLLFISLFLPWVGFDVPDIPDVAGVAVPEVDSSLSGWEANNTLDIYLFILAAFAIVPAAMSMGGSNEELPLVNNAATFLLGAIGTIMTVYVLLDADGRKIGLILATLAVIGVTVGAYLAMQDEVGAEY